MGTRNMRLEVEKGGCSIVLIGSFNPNIFTPYWFVYNGIATESEGESANINIVHSEISNFTLGSKLIQVDLNRFSVESTEAPWVALMDFVATTFGQFLLHSPISRLGINRQVHFGVRDEVTRNNIGRRLTPTSAWGEWGAKIEAAPQDHRGGFASLTMQETKADGSGWIQATVQPSQLIKQNSGIFMIVNDDYVLKGDDVRNAKAAVNELSTEFEGSIQRSEWIIDQIMALSL
jgi:hypothetical protein